MRTDSDVPYSYGGSGLGGFESIQIVRRNDGTYDYIHIPDISLAESIAVNDECERIYYGARPGLDPNGDLEGFSFITSLDDQYNDPTSYSARDMRQIQPSMFPVGTPSFALPAGEGDDTTVLFVTYLTEDGKEESVPSAPSRAFGYMFGDSAQLIFTVPSQVYNNLIPSAYRIYMEVDGTARLVTELGRPDVNFFSTSQGQTVLVTPPVTLQPGATTIEMATLDSSAPPEDGLQNVINWHNGMLAAVSVDGRSVLISEPGNAISWPREIPFGDRNIVRIIRSGDMLVVLTDARPSVIYGGDPNTAQEVDIDFAEPCVSAHSVVDMGFGIAYLSQNGICVISNGSGYIATQDNRHDGGTAVIDPWEHDGRGARASCYHGQYVYYVKNGDVWDGRSYSFKYAELMRLPSIPGNLIHLVKNPDATVGDETLEIFVQNDVVNPMRRLRFQSGTGRVRAHWEREIELPKAEPLAFARVTATDYNDIFFHLGEWSVRVRNDRPFPVKSTNRGRTTTIGLTGASDVQVLQIAQSVEELY